MSCKKCSSGERKCGCKDTALTTPISFQCPPDARCPNPQTCSEYIDAACVLSSQIGIYNLNIPPGASLQQILQTLDIVISEPSCADPESECQATLYIYPVAITSTTVTLAWIENTTATDYQVEYKLDTDVSWTQLTSQVASDPRQVYITGLTADSTYYFRVNSICSEITNCYSSIIVINTLA